YYVIFPSVFDTTFYTLSLKRCILPEAVFGISLINSIILGYLYGARFAFTYAFNSASNSSDGATPSFKTIHAFGRSRFSSVLTPTTATSRTASCLSRVASTSTGDTQIPPTFNMSSERPEYQK